MDSSAVATTLDYKLKSASSIDPGHLHTVGGISGTGLIKADGSVPLTANWDVGSFQVRAETFQSDVATGTAPLTVASTTVVTNLNADTVDGVEASAFTLKSTLTTRGDIYYASAANTPNRLAVGSSGTILRSDGTDPAWSTLTAALDDILTTSGDIFVNSGGTVTRLAGATSAQYLLGRTTASIVPAYIPMHFFNVKAYGATGDSVTNDTTAIQAAITAAQSAGGGYVVFPPGGYVVTVGSLTISSDKVALLGGMATLLTTGNGHTLTISANWCAVVDLGITLSSGTQASGSAIHLSSGFGADISGCFFSGNWYDCIHVTNAYEAHVTQNHFLGYVRAGFYHDAVVTPDQGDSSLIDNEFNASGTTDIEWHSGGGLRIAFNKMVGSNTNGVLISIDDGVTTGGVQVHNNNIESKSGYGIRAVRTGTTGVLNHLDIVGNHIDNTATNGVGISLADAGEVYTQVTSNEILTTGVGIAVAAAVVSATVSNNYLKSCSTGISWAPTDTSGLGWNTFVSCTTNQTANTPIIDVQQQGGYHIWLGANLNASSAKEGGSIHYASNTLHLTAVQQGTAWKAMQFNANTFSLAPGGTTGFFDMASTGAITINDGGSDVDLRIEGDTATNLVLLDASADAVWFGTTTAGNLLKVDPAGFVYNENGADIDWRFEGDTATSLVVLDAGLDAFQVGTTTAGTLMDLRATATVFNEAGADIDFRIEGTGTPNAFFVDGANGYVGKGTATPSYPLDFQPAQTALIGASLAPSSITGSGTNQSIVFVGGTHAGTGAGPLGFWVKPTFAPASGTTTTAMGTNVDAIFAPATGVTITNGVTFRAVGTTGSDAGTVSNLFIVDITKSYGSQKPGAVTGLRVNNVGAAGITTSTALSISAQSGSGTNYGFVSAAVLNGFGTLTPSYPLHVVGTTYLSSVLLVNGAQASGATPFVMQQIVGNNGVYITLDTVGSTPPHASSYDIQFGWDTANPPTYAQIQAVHQGTGYLPVVVTNSKFAVGVTSPSYTFQTAGSAQIGGSGDTLGFYGATPAARPTAYTQTYSTANKTLNADGVTDPAAYGAGANGYSTGAMASAVHAAVIALHADLLDTKQMLNSVIDDLQTLGLLQ